jgi:plastocyanin
MPRFAFLLASLAASLAPTFAPAQTAPAVEITRFAYVPQDITVAPGTTVVWTNRDETPQTVTDRTGALASPALDTDDRYEHTFGAEGDYPYYCAVHPFMTGVVHVRQP